MFRGNHLETLLQEHYKVDESFTASVLFAFRPLEIAMSRWLFRHGLMLVYTLAGLADALMGRGPLASNGLNKYQHVKFEFTDFAEGTCSGFAFPNRSHHAGILWHGRPWHVPGSTVRERPEDCSLILSLPDTQAFNGVFVEEDPSGRSGELRNLQVSGSVDMATWHELLRQRSDGLRVWEGGEAMFQRAPCGGASAREGWLSALLGTLSSDHLLPCEFASERTLALDLRNHPSSELWNARSWLQFCTMFLFWLAPSIGWIRHCSTLLAVVIGCEVVCFWMQWALWWTHQPILLLQGAVWAVGTVAFLSDQRLVAHCLVAGGLIELFTAIHLLQQDVLVNYASGLMVQASINTVGLLLVVGYRAYILWSTSLLMRKFSAKYEACWQQLLSCPEQRQALNHLAALCSSFPCAAPPRHMQAVVDTTREGPSTPALAGCGAVVATSLDQLYAQATLLQPLLSDKVARLALLCGAVSCPAPGVAAGSSEGFLATGAVDRRRKATERYEVWEEAIKAGRGGVKSLSRTIEKIQRCYNEDASLCTDMCRDSLCFPSVAALASCLAAIDADPELQVLKVTNRLDPEHAGRSSWGYRDVNLKLWMVNPLTEELGLQWHVCELQLLLEDFSALKSEAGHATYRVVRTLRSE